MKYDIFISYSRHDKKIVHDFYEKFQSWGYKVWLDKDGIESGDAFVSVIVKAIMESQIVVFFSSEHSNSSSWTTKEIALAVEEKKRIIPIKLDTVKYNDAIRFQLIDLDYVDYYSNKREAEIRIQKTLQTELGSKGSLTTDESNSNRTTIKKKWLFIPIVIIVVGFIILFSLLPSKPTTPADLSTVDSVTQKVCKHILLKGMENCNADYGQIIVMECSTGKVRAMVEFYGQETSDEDGNVCYTYNEGYEFSFKEESKMMGFVSLLACLESNKIDTASVVDTGWGVKVVRGDTIKDHNWRKGGFGEITVKQAMSLSSDIAKCSLVDSIYGGRTLDFYNRIKSMGYGIALQLDSTTISESEFLYPDSPYSWLGYNVKINPMQLLAFFNSIANNGVMVKPLFKESNTPVIVKGNSFNVQTLSVAQELLKKNVIEGLNRKVQSEEFPIAGIQSCTNIGLTSVLKDGQDYYCMQNYAYFPLDTPKYSIIVTINKKGLPASSGGMCGPIIKDIAEIIFYNKQ